MSPQTLEWNTQLETPNQYFIDRANSKLIDQTNTTVCIVSKYLASELAQGFVPISKGYSSAIDNIPPWRIPVDHKYFTLY